MIYKKMTGFYKPFKMYNRLGDGLILFYYYTLASHFVVGKLRPER